MRCTEGVHSMGEHPEKFQLVDDWNIPSDFAGEKKHWTGSTTFYVDKVPTPEWGTDQRRQRKESQLFIRILEEMKSRHSATSIFDNN